MSYDVNLLDPVTKQVLTIETPHHMRGGTYAIGGDNELHLNITYNYARLFYLKINEEKGIRFLYGKTGVEAIPILKQAISKLGDDVDEDYWKPTEGNAKRALLQLLAMSQMRPDGVWAGD